jgi:hypothetical protein
VGETQKKKSSKQQRGTKWSWVDQRPVPAFKDIINSEYILKTVYKGLLSCT